MNNIRKGTSMADTRERIRSFLAQFFHAGRLADDQDMFATGLVNSLFVMQLVLFVETELGCTVEDEDLEIQNFNTVDAITRLVGRKTGVELG